MSLARRNITQYPPLNKGKLALTLLQISQNYDDPPSHPPPTNIVNILESFTCYVLKDNSNTQHNVKHCQHNVRHKSTQMSARCGANQENVRDSTEGYPQVYITTLCAVTHSTSVSGTKSTSLLCSIKSPISEVSDCASSSESSGSSESLDCSSESPVAALLAWG